MKKVTLIQKQNDFIIILFCPAKIFILCYRVLSLDWPLFPHSPTEILSTLLSGKVVRLIMQTCISRGIYYPIISRFCILHKWCVGCRPKFRYIFEILSSRNVFYDDQLLAFYSQKEKLTLLYFSVAPGILRSSLACLYSNYLRNSQSLTTPWREVFFHWGNFLTLCIWDVNDN